MKNKLNRLFQKYPKRQKKNLLGFHLFYSFEEGGTVHNKKPSKTIFFPLFTLL